MTSKIEIRYDNAKANLDRTVELHTAGRYIWVSACRYAIVHAVILARVAEETENCSPEQPDACAKYLARALLAPKDAQQKLIQQAESFLREWGRRYGVEK